MESGWRSYLVGALLLACWAYPRALESQQGWLLRYTPRPGGMTRTVLQAEGTVVLRDKTGGVLAPDSIVGQMYRLAGVTRRVVSANAERSVVEVTVDSLRTRARLLGQSWSESAIADSMRLPFRVELDDRYRWMSAPPWEALSAVPEWLGVEFPAEPVARGGSWNYRTSYRVPAALNALFELTINGPVEGSVNVVLDSAVARLTDTLLYFTVQRHLGPVTLPAVDAGDSAEIAVAGASSGILVWSTGWQAFVSGSEQIRLRGNLRGMGREGLREAELTWTVFRRLQLRP
ncbi:MAG: hypothetical protein KatS3mg081_1125 [Gemmatimonadales bacterium]|nr:MAG: hypothetical protein KatS3mg081_1125 [Gemmatimonadales bacterium]